MNRRATDVDRAFSAIGVQMNYVTFGPRKLPETSNELKKIFTYNDMGEGEYRAPDVVEEDPALSLSGLPGAVVETVAPEQVAPPTTTPPAPPTSVPSAVPMMRQPPVAAPPQRQPPAPSQPAAPPRAPERPIPIAARAPQPQPQPQQAPPLRETAPRNPPQQGWPIASPSSHPVSRPNLIHPEMVPHAARPTLPMPVNEGFGLPEVWRERREVRNPATAPVVEERSLAAMFRMLGSRAHGNLTETPGEDEEPTDPNGDDLFRRL